MNVGRPLQFDPDKVLEQAMETFWARGYEATTLQELLDAMQLSKSSLYQAFGSKQALFTRCIHLYMDRLADELVEELDGAPSARGFIEGTFMKLADDAGCARGERGCLLWNTALEFGQRDPQVTRLVANGIDRFTRVFSRAVKRAQAEGEIAADKDPGALGSYLLSSMSGLRGMMKGGVGAHRAREVAKLVLQALD